MAWIWLILSGIEEIVATIAMKYVDGFKRKTPIIVMSVGFLFSFYCLSHAMMELPAGVAYAVWAGVGAIGITIVGVFWFKEKMNKKQVFFLACILVGVIGMRLTI